MLSKSIFNENDIMKTYQKYKNLSKRKQGFKEKPRKYYGNTLSYTSNVSPKRRNYLGKSHQVTRSNTNIQNLIEEIRGDLSSKGLNTSHMKVIDDDNKQRLEIIMSGRLLSPNSSPRKRPRMRSKKRLYQAIEDIKSSYKSPSSKLDSSFKDFTAANREARSSFKTSGSIKMLTMNALASRLDIDSMFRNVSPNKNNKRGMLSTELRKVKSFIGGLSDNDYDSLSSGYKNELKKLAETILSHKRMQQSSYNFI